MRGDPIEEAEQEAAEARRRLADRRCQQGAAQEVEDRREIGAQLLELREERREIDFDAFELR
jgi:hypothetical protein